MTPEQIREKIHGLVDEYYIANKNNFRKFIPGETYIYASRKLFDSKELILGVDAVLDGWWTEGRFATSFSQELKKYLGVRSVILVNSGSSANLIAFMSLTSPILGERRIKPGDEVITVAAGFPTTINPILQAGAVPVFVDINVGTYNAVVSEIESAITKKTKAIVLAHTLGIPYDLDEIVRICKTHNLWLMEDCCDALGSRYNDKMVGTFGDIATLSFYPAHHITTGEGGAAFTNNQQLAQIAFSFRDWGRSCYCKPGTDNTCGRRFSQQHGDLPFGYDHKFVYSHIGYNLKMSDMQAAIGLAQLSKLPGFISARQEHFKELYTFFKEYEDKFYLPIIDDKSTPSYFGFPLTIKEDANFVRTEIVEYLDEHKVGTRLLFCGNVTKQPYFIDNNVKYRKASDLKNTDLVMNNTFWIGVQPEITPEMLEYVKDVFRKFLKDKI
ncbi:MAG: lipopolysaccharide biosynthesis protein RfbH [Candidatus Woesearchaeota archaeon]